MIVGDPKQSIYRWRGGKAEQFIELSKDNNPFANPDKKLEHLDKKTTYSQVIEFNNEFSSCCHQNLNNQITKIYTRITVTRSLMINWVVTLISFIPKEESTEEVEEA
jgi:superfamily I DNA/RNA helicase